MSRAVSDKSKIQGNSLPEVVRAWKQCSLDLSGDPDIIKAARGALRDGNLLNAFLLYCLSLDDEERKEAAARGLRTLERLKERDDPTDLRRIDPVEFRALGGNPDLAKEPGGGATPRRGRQASPEVKRSKRTG